MSEQSQDTTRYLVCPVTTGQIALVQEFQAKQSKCLSDESEKHAKSESCALGSQHHAHDHIESREHWKQGNEKKHVAHVSATGEHVANKRHRNQKGPDREDGLHTGLVES
jgi:hypothetical protein